MTLMKKSIKNTIENLPRTAGVYLFYGSTSTPRAKKEEILYIGKAINLKDRVKNHFQQPTYKDKLFVHTVQKIDYLPTQSEIEALILEANLIKKHQPKFNQIWRDDKKYFYIAFENKKRPVIFITHQKNNSDTHYIGPFVDGTSLKKTLKFLRRVFPYYTASKHPLQRCTWCHLDVCPGPNPDLTEYKKNIKKLMLVLEGKSTAVLRQLKKELQTLSSLGKFEEAIKVRDRIFALEKILSHKNVITTNTHQYDWSKTEVLLQNIINAKYPISKIECYDISNIQGKFATGSMVVFVDGAPEKSQYKKFKIQMKNEPNDIAMLKEVLTRRLLREDWPYPEIMLIDGGIAQLNVAIGAKNANPKTQGIKIISIAKGKRELLIEGKEKISLKDLPQEVYNVIVSLDDEAHRFAITYHKKLRKENLLK